MKMNNSFDINLPTREEMERELAFVQEHEEYWKKRYSDYINMGSREQAYGNFLRKHNKAFTKGWARRYDKKERYSDEMVYHLSVAGQRAWNSWIYYCNWRKEINALLRNFHVIEKNWVWWLEKYGESLFEKTSEIWAKYFAK